jgi:hypothetical protein
MTRAVNLEGPHLEMWHCAHREAMDLAERFVGHFTAMDMPQPDAGSVVAHALLRAAYRVAADGQVASGNEPSPLRFVAAAAHAAEAAQ